MAAVASAKEKLVGDGSTSMVMPAIVTPLTKDGSLDEDSARRLVRHLYAQGVGGIYVCGSTGEGLYLDRATRRRMTEVMVEESAGKGKVIVHVGAAADQDAFHLARHAAATGADAISSLPKFVGGGHSFTDTLEFYRTLGASTELPVLAYYIPQVTGVSWTLGQIKQLLALPGIGGLKFSALDIYNIQRLKAIGALNAETQLAFSGPDQMFVFGLQLGADGGIGTSYNFLAPQFINAERLVRSGDFKGALEVQETINEVCEIYKSFNQMAACKLILFWQGLIECPRKASASSALSEAQAEELRARLESTLLGPTLKR
eukprot:INCI13468.2.p1 GENE.INCI13468.2~~INCI13468.2.p1  ORF type:complete len:317 (-),score=49.86 INCI13468.2:3014-3964(-)